MQVLRKKGGFTMVSGKNVLLLMLSLLVFFTLGAAGAEAEMQMAENHADIPELSGQDIVDEDINKGMGDLQIGSATIVNGDVTLNMGKLTVDGVVRGNAKCNIGEIIINGDVNGNVSGNMGKMVINGNVAGDADANLGEVIVKGDVAGNVNGGMGKVDIIGSVGGDVITQLGHLQISGHVGGNVRSEGKNIDISGMVDGDVTMPRGMVNLFDEAVVSGTIHVEQGLVEAAPETEAGEIVVDKELTPGEVEKLFRSNGISFLGLDSVFEQLPFLDNIQFDRHRYRPGFPEMFNFFGLTWSGFAGRLARGIINMAIFFALSALIFTLFPKQVHNVRTVLDFRTGKVVLWGLLAAFLAIPLAIFLVITIIGIPLILVEVLTLLVAYLLGYVGIAILIGERVLHTMARQSNPLGQIALGVVLLGVISLIPVVGALVSIGIFILAVGAALYSRFGSQIPPQPVLSYTGPGTPPVEKSDRMGGYTYSQDQWESREQKAATFHQNDFDPEEKPNLEDGGENTDSEASNNSTSDPTDSNGIDEEEK